MGQSGRRSPGSWWSVTITSIPARAGGRHLVGAGDPAVGRQQQAGAAGGQPLHPGDGQPVAVAEPVGDVPVAARPQLPQRPDQDRGRADAVAVVVAVDRDRAPVGDRAPDPLGHLLHRVELERIVRLGRLEEGAGLGDRPVAASNERHRDGLGQLERLHQRPDLGVGIGLEREGSPGGLGIGHADGHLSQAKNGRGRNPPPSHGGGPNFPAYAREIRPTAGSGLQRLLSAHAEGVDRRQADQGARDRDQGGDDVGLADARPGGDLGDRRR